jgi:pimeloyl-[acyl-carrier protein] synthase
LSAADAEPLEFNPFLPEVHRNPYPLYHRLREESPVHLNFSGVWLLTRYSDVQRILRDPAVFSSDSRNSDLYRAFMASIGDRDLGLIGDDTARSMLFTDPPDHDRLRALVSQAFTARRIAAMRPHIQEIADGLIEGVEPSGGFDVVAQIAYPLPVTVICEMLGVPVADRHLFHRWSQELVPLLDPLVTLEVVDRANVAVTAFHQYFDALAGERRSHPRGDLLSALIQAEDEGERLTHQELRTTCVLLLVAGHETTVNLISNGVLALLQNPAQMSALRAGPSLLRNAVEEMLRYDSPVQFVGRTLLQDMEIGGKGIVRGDQVVGILGAANRDPAQFPDPDSFDISRSDVRHLSFSGGIHFCLGAQLARTEGQSAIAALVHRFPTLELATDLLEWRDTVTLRGLKSLPVTVG